MANAQQYELAASTEMDRRQPEAQELFSVAFDADERPWFASDIATLGILYLGNEDELRHKLEKHYGLRVTREQFNLPLWQFLDYLSAHRAAEAQLATIGS